MFRFALPLSFCVGAAAQQPGTVKENYQLPLPIQQCTNDGCVEEQTAVTLDANWRWLHDSSGYENCFKDGGWNSAVCASGAECAAKCAMEGVTEADWTQTYGISSRDGGVRVKFKTGDNVGSRFYLLDPSETYKQFKLKNREITFDVDVSTLPCGMNGAVYFSEMSADGGKSATNTAGSAYGTGYCDAQCPGDVKFIDGEANPEAQGSCCAEMDLWEANNQATAFTAHPCAVDKPYKCKGDECKTICDKPGCDFNSYRLGARSFYGPGQEFAVNTLKPFTIVTQFITADGTDSGDLTEIRRFYVQDGKKIENSKATINGLGNHSSLTDASCTLDKQIFGEKEDTTAKYGGLKKMGDAIGRGMTLVLSLWDDGYSHMRWLDSMDPVGGNPEQPGVARGPCSADAGDPSDVRSRHADAYVDYFNFKYGELGSTVTLKRRASRPKSPAGRPKSVPSAKAPKSPAAGKCCFVGGCDGICRGVGFCASGRLTCEALCKGTWCAGTSLGQVKKHRQLRGSDHVFLQRLLRFSASEKGLHRSKRAAEL